MFQAQEKKMIMLYFNSNNSKFIFFDSSLLQENFK